MYEVSSFSRSTPPCMKFTDKKDGEIDSEWDHCNVVTVNSPPQRLL